MLDDNRLLARVSWDSASWLVAAPIATLLRFDFAPPQQFLLRSLALGALLASIQFTSEYLILAHRGRDIIASFEESATTLAQGIVIALGGTLVLSLVGAFLPRSIPLIAGMIAMAFMLSARFVVRARRLRKTSAGGATPAIIYGAGESGQQLIRQMLQAHDHSFSPVAVLDDNPRKQGLRIHGVKVEGTLEALEESVRRHSAQILVVAITGISARQLRTLNSRTEVLGVKLNVIPSTSQLLDGSIKLDDISLVRDEDLLGRQPVITDEDAIQRFLDGKRILVTGAAGSIGSEIVRQLHRYGPSWIGILDRDESSIHNLQLTLEGHGLLTGENLILADIRDRSRMFDVVHSFQPDIVFHAAALKHLTLLERFPEEAHKTNVEGTNNVLDAAIACGVSTFVNISTDKAANPSSVLGETKLKTEQLTSRASRMVQESLPRKFISVRFGNVLGSRGSVLTTFRHQIAQGGPVTVTDPQVKRYFMTIPEAVHLVLQAGVIGENGETVILDMGDPISILDVAKHMIAVSGREIDIVFTGLRPGEKTEEILISPDDEVVGRKHPRIIHTIPRTHEP